MNKRVLVVDDDRFLQASVQELLEDEAYEVDTAIDGLDALEKLDSQCLHYDVIIMDMTMPRMDGLRLLQALRQRAWTSFASIIAFSADGRALQQAVRMGIRHAISKPFDLETFLALVDYVSSGDCALSAMRPASSYHVGAYAGAYRVETQEAVQAF